MARARETANRKTSALAPLKPPANQYDIGFDLRSLHIFISVCTAGGMTAASSKLGLTQPAVSQAILALEEGIGTALFDRRVRPLALTVAGDLLKERALRILEEARQVAPAVRMGSRARLVSVRIGTPASVSGLITSALASLLQPRVKHLLMWSGAASVHRAALISRRLNMIVTNDPIETFRDFERHLIVEEPFIKVLPAAFRALADQGIAETAEALPFIRYANRSYIGKRVERQLQHLQLTVPHCVEVDRTEQVTAMVEGAAGWAITTPLCLLEARPNDAKLAVAPLPPPVFHRRLTLVAHRKELGRLPLEVAQTIQRVLKEDCLPRLRELMPWIGDDMRFGGKHG